MDKTETLEKLLSRADDLPVLPHIGMEILHLIEDKYSVPTDFENVIENDQVLTLKILKLANSAYYGYPREILSIKEAIIILGLDTLKSLVLSLLTRQMLSKKLEHYGLKNGELWEHSLIVGMIARSLARSMKISNLERYFIAGLLHDIGKLVFDVFIDSEVHGFEDMVLDSELEITEVENRVSGHDHAWLGAKLIERWNLPEFLVHTVEFHHDYNSASPQYRKDAYLINVADRLSYKVFDRGKKTFSLHKEVLPEEYGKLGMTGADMEALLRSIRQSMESVKIS